MERMATAREVSEYTQIPLQVIYRKTRDGRIPSYRSGRTVRYRMDEVVAAMKEDADVKKRGTRRRGNLAE